MSFIDVPNADNDLAGAGPDVPPTHLAVLQGDKPGVDAGCARWTDQQLVFAASEVREAAFAELFRRHSGHVAAVARMVLGTASSGADDVVAEVFAALWSAPDKFDPRRGSLRGFLRLGARGRSLDLLRSESNRQRRERHDESSMKLRSAIDDELLAAESDQELRRAVAQLPGAERTVIELAYFAQMTYKAVASQLGLPEGTVKSRIRTGLQRLRSMVGTGNDPARRGSPTVTDSNNPRVDRGDSE